MAQAAWMPMVNQMMVRHAVVDANLSNKYPTEILARAGTKVDIKITM